MDTIDLLLHPVRLRIVHAMSDGKTHTTGQLCARVPGVSKATMYRHVDRLAEGGLLEVEGEQRVRGAVERRYRLGPVPAVVGAEAAAAMSAGDHRKGFAAAMATLIAEFDTYLDRADARPVADAVSYRQATVWLDDDELADVVGQLKAAIVPRMQNGPAPGRRSVLVSTILFPAGTEEAPEGPDEE
ncbi:helix-turn-helix domain-containing protein [Streptomyces sp. NPDC087300]|uniref:helix-turn-helix domain-containing protein n=1 Tax=Streptomyces sp. NPDC087300 TaxID=3365780 RepID=UPI0038217639